jgi:hypothetical protein
VRLMQALGLSALPKKSGRTPLNGG